MSEALVTKALGQVCADIGGMRRVLGFRTTFRWVLALCATLPACFRARALFPADRRLGDGPHQARYGVACASLMGPNVVSGIREVWVRDVYLAGGFLTIPPAGKVIDLGANIGVFSMLGLAHGQDVEVVAAEPSQESLGVLLNNARINNWQARVRLLPVFVGEPTRVQELMLLRPGAKDLAWLDADGVLASSGFKDVDLLKCDIEGSEYALLGSDSNLLQRCRQIAVEIHGDGARRKVLLDQLRSAGFEVIVRRETSTDCIANARRPYANRVLAGLA